MPIEFIPAAGACLVSEIEIVNTATGQPVPEGRRQDLT